MPSSSSSDEDLAKFKEAADSSLYNDSLFTRKQGLEEQPLTAPPPSLRYVDEEEGDRVHNDLRVTPSFQKHVAKKLSKLLDSQMDSDTGSPNTSRNVLKPKRRKQVCSSEDDTNSSGVRLFGASAVFLSSMNILPPPPQRRKRGRKVAHFTSGSDSSSEDSDSDSMKNVSAAAVSPDWLLSGDATKGWMSSKGKVERCVVDKTGCLIPIRNGFEALSEVSCSNNNSNEIPNRGIQSDMTNEKLSKKKKASQVESELAASFSSVVSIGSDSQGDVSNPSGKQKSHKRWKKQRKDLYSEDATTETTEVEEVVERRKKKRKKGRKKPKCQRVEEKESEETLLKEDCVPGLLEENDGYKSKRKEKKRRKKERKKEREQSRESSYLKIKRPSKVNKKGTSAKRLRKKIRHLSDDLAKLMMTPNETSQD